MLEIDGYRFHKKIHASPISAVYRGVREADGLEVVAKVYTAPATTAAESDAGRERALIERIDCPDLVRPVAVELCGQRWALVTEHVAGEPLDAFFEGGAKDFGVALTVATGVARALAQIHAARIVHKDIKPGNVLVSAETHEITIIDLGIADEIGTAEDAIIPEVARGSCHYVAPEQTGRMRAGVDFRSDIYAFGATLYHVLTGRPPFDGSDLGKVLNAHLAQAPTPPHVLRPDVPEVLSRIVLCCLEKDPDARYQTAYGLTADLAACADAWAARGALDPDMRLGQHDRSDRIRFRNVLYGREREIARIESLVERCATDGPQLLLIAGRAGVGKSSLAFELERRTLHGEGHFASAKFDAQQRDVPYFAFRGALDGLADQLLIESGAPTGRRWTQRLRRELGGIGQVLARLAPNFACMLDDVDTRELTKPANPSAQICETLRRLVRVVTEGGVRLVLCLDDLQWADSGSRELLRAFSTWAGSAPVMLVGTYRSEERGENAALDELLEDLDRQTSVPIETIAVEPLTVSDSNLFLADALERSPEDTRWLAERLDIKTGNNPFFLKQMILHLRSEGLLRVGPQGWTWDPDDILSAGVFDDAVQFLAAKIQSIDPVHRRVLMVASCVGDAFDTEQVYELCELDRMSVHTALAELASEGLVTPCREGFRFVHDRIREAASSLWSAPERAELHAHVVRRVLAETSERELERRAFELADHVRQAEPALTREERVPAARCHVRAAARAKSAGSAGSAASYLDRALALLGGGDWTGAPELTFEALLMRAEICVVLADYAQADRRYAELTGRDLSPLQRAQVDALHVYSVMQAKGVEAALDPAIDALARIGVKIPRQPSRFGVRRAVRAMRRAADAMTDDLYLRPPERIEERQLCLMVLQRRVAPVISGSHIAGMLYLNREILDGIRRFGSIRPPAHWPASAAITEAGTGGDIMRVKRWSEQALRLSEKYPDPELGHRSELLVHTVASGWYQHARKALDPLQRIGERALELGDATYLTFVAFSDVLIRLYSGAPLGEVAESTARWIAKLPEREQLYSYLLRAYERWIAVLRDEPLRDFDWTPPPGLLLPGRTRAHLHTGELMLRTIVGDRPEAHPATDIAGDTLRLRHAFGLSPIMVQGFCMFQGLAIAHQLRRKTGHRRRLQAVLVDRERRLRSWAKSCPQNFLAPADLLRGDLEALAGHRDGAITHYARASEQALAQGFLHIAALALERESRARSTTGDPRSLEAHDRAVDLYAKWGARAKVNRLHHRRSRG